MTRRQAIATGGKVVIGAVVGIIVGGAVVDAYYATKAPATVTATATSTVTATATSTATTTVTPTTSLPSTVKLGAVLSLSGPFAGFGQGLQFGHKQAIADLNAQGGININGTKIPVSYTVYDDASDPTKSASLTSELILTNNVDAVVHGNAPPDNTNPICVACDRYGVPAVVGGPFEPWWAGGPYKYCWSILFRIATPAPGYPKGYTIADNYLGLTGQYSSTGQTNKNVALLTCDDTDGAGWYGVFSGSSGVLQSAGYSTPDPQLYPPGTTDFSSMINTWKGDDTDIIWGNLPPPDWGTFWRQAAELNYRPKIAVIGRAPLFYTDISSWGDNLPQGVNTECWWDPAWPGQVGIGSTTSQSLASAWATSTGLPLNRGIGYGYTAVQIVADSMSRAGTLDKDSVNTAIGETNGTFMRGPVQFLAATHDSPSGMTIAQWQPSTGSVPWVEPIVYSLISARPTTGTEIFPLPPWP